jgi:hypothetical protein
MLINVVGEFSSLSAEKQARICVNENGHTQSANAMQIKVASAPGLYTATPWTG